MKRKDLAVAVKYEALEHSVPKVIAAGRGFLAKQIINTADASGVTVVENPDLAKALGEIKVGSEIPEVLYGAVAEVLAFVYSLDKKYKGL